MSDTENKTNILEDPIIVHNKPEVFVPIDDWMPQNEDEEIFTFTSQAICCKKICSVYGLEPDSPIGVFIISAKRGYNSTTKEKDGKVTIGFKNHCTQYLNYFEKFYDTTNILVGIYGTVKYCIDYMPSYTEQNFINDLFRYVISYSKDANPELHMLIHNLVIDNYNIHLAYSNTKNPVLEYTDDHAEVLMEISFIQNCIIPLIMHFAWRNKYSSIEIKHILITVFDMILQEIDKKYNTVIAAKLYETTTTNVNRSVSNNKVLWGMQDIRGRNNTTHSIGTVENLIVQVFPKYSFNKNIICFNYDVIEREINYKVIEAPYEFHLISVSSSERDEDNNSEADKFEAHISKLDESLLIQSNVNCAYSMEKIKRELGPFDPGEINFYISQLTKGNKLIKNGFQFNLVVYPFLKIFKDIKSVRLLNIRDYITLMLATKRYLIAQGQTLLPYVIGGRVERLVSRKTVNKKIMQRMQLSENYNKVIEKYNNRKIQEDIIFKTISQILSSKFTNIDYWNLDLNGEPINTQLVPEKVCEEVLQYILLI